MKRSADDDSGAPRRHRGAHDAPNLTGYWRLDKERSTPIDTYLRAMGLCEIAIDGHHQKEASTETYYDITQTAHTLTTRKQSWSGASSHELTFNKPQTHNGGAVPKRITATIRGDAVVTTFEMGSRTLYDIKTLEDGGRAIRVDLQLVCPGEQIDIARWLVQCDVAKEPEEAEPDVEIDDF
ncbi:hypothetical protein M885DRAFT_620648 [Pelagophyceae sp. CCMP2097]|nr:hypothetical protein M885DRAFT_620648 [Pelagophyceae sp. CCMP2097]|mmetsp:Transcript_30891/g.104031  ORF Transcript_30891/g.104031 Transcript_30891/m.104031 type:complete len:181 (-) Transcript_30891:72-614(-)